MRVMTRRDFMAKRQRTFSAFEVLDLLDDDAGLLNDLEEDLDVDEPCMVGSDEFSDCQEEPDKMEDERREGRGLYTHTLVTQ